MYNEKQRNQDTAPQKISPQHTTTTRTYSERTTSQKKPLKSALKDKENPKQTKTLKNTVQVHKSQK
jgi:hypothetical protein